MTERIKELIAQAREPLHNTNLPFDQGLMEYSEKFAELIVRECMEQVWYTREDGINGNISEVIKQRMKQHFGVEEN